MASTHTHTHTHTYGQAALDSALNEAALVLRSGGVVALPTEIVYRIAASIKSRKVVPDQGQKEGKTHRHLPQ